MTDLLELAARIEAASGPDREIDARIAVALRLGCRPNLPDDLEYLSLVRDDDFESAGTYWFHCRSGKSLRTSLPYTGSLDAAMTLVPEGWVVERLSIWPQESSATLCGTREGKDGLRWHNFGDGRAQGTAKTAPLAIALAALRARASEQKE